jgi:hypothetical protein
MGFWGNLFFKVDSDERFCGGNYWSHSANFDYHFIIAFSPLREYIQDIPLQNLKKRTELALKSDSLTNALRKWSIYTVYSKVLNGQLEYAKFNKDSILAASDEAVPQLTYFKKSCN